MHIPALLAQLQMTAEAWIFAGSSALGIGIQAYIANKAAIRGAAVHDEKLKTHGERLDEHDSKLTSMGRELFSQGKDIANIKGRLDA